jgi:PAS domain S-box-containing protein
MNSPWRLGFFADTGYEVLWEDAERIFCKTWRVGVAGDRQVVLAVLYAEEHPSPESLSRLAHEYALRDELDGAWAARPLELIRVHGRPVLFLEFPGGEPLGRLIGTPMSMERFLRLAVSIAAALGRLHERGLVHKDIKPVNILINSAMDCVWLTGFGIASRLPRERQSPEAPEFIAGTLAYMAPEQTGRMNRSIDSRTDLYAFGVTLYEMLTGRLPFTASDPMEWVHCHIARPPAPPSERVKNLPGSVSAIIMKLLAKTAEERYQTAAGAESDLRRCLAEWETRGEIDEFLPGEHDTPDRLLIPEKLYGRTVEIDTLLASFDRVVAGGRPELVLVSGYSGIGKSAVVNELHKPLVAPRGLFASGKFDQYKRDIPYATLAQAFQGLIRPLLSKTEAELRQWREALLEALEPNGRLIVDLVPELKHIIGEQPPVPELPPRDAQGRFQLVFRRFISVFARPERPLALFLDDLQWLDAATLDLLEDLLTRPNVENLLLIGAYRDNEVDPFHPLMRKLEAMRQAGAILQDIVLAPLTCEDLGQLIADCVHSEPARIMPLARLIHEKTTGNPLFAIQFISALADEALLTFDYGEARWCWDLNNIHAKGYTDNVVDLMVGKLNRLSAETRNALQKLACLGNAGRFTILRIVYQHSEEEMHGQLWEAVRAGLIFRSEDSYKFLHDRVQEAAYCSIPEESRPEAHLRIGMLLAAQTPPEKLEETIFEIVNQLNRGSRLITSIEMLERVAELNLIAGRRAKTSTAYASALNYLVAGAALLPGNSWERQHDLIFELELHRAECELLTGALAEAEQRLVALSARAATTIERARVTCLQVDLYTTLDQGSRAIAVGLDYLRHLGIDWSPHPTEDEARREYERIWSQLGSRTIESLIDLPLMSNEASLATLDVLTKLGPPAHYTDANVRSMVICRAVNLSLENGNCDGSCYAYAVLGRLAGPEFGDYEAGLRFGRVGYELVERRGLKRFQARTYLNFGYLLMFWTRHVREGRELLRRAFETANQIGDLTFAAYYYTHLNTYLLAAGDPLDNVQVEVEHGLAFARNIRFGFAVDSIAGQLGLVRTLRGLTPIFGSFDDAQFDELLLESRFRGNPDLALAEGPYWIRKLQARYFAGDYAGALEASSKAQKLQPTSASFFECAEYHFYSALSRAASYGSAVAGQWQEHLRALAEHHRQLEVWATACPENFEDRAALVGAEIARIEGRELDAEHLYEQAIRSARTRGFVHNEALANEVAAHFYAARGFEKIAHAYLQDARNGYIRWRAFGKVRQLDELYPHLREERPVTGFTGTIGATVEQLDLATVIKVSQAVSGEIVLEKLIDTLMRTAIEHAGAGRGLLILAVGDGYRIEAEVTTSNDTVTVGQRQTSVTAASLPESILHYVIRTKESVLLHDAAAANPFSGDKYIHEHHARSILCLPLLKQGRLAGVLYLENNLTAHVFTPDRVAVLKVLVSQAAISLENSRLYDDLADREGKIRCLVDANIIGIFIADREGRILEANDAFLRIVGYDREDLVRGRLNRNELTPPERRELDKRAWGELNSIGRLQPFEKEYFRKDGSRVPVLIGAALFKEGGDQGLAFVVDLTERKRAEEALRESERSLRSAIDGIPGLVGILAPNGDVEAVNRQILEYCGQSLEEVRDWRTNGTVPHDDLPHLTEVFTRSIASGIPYQLEHRLRRFDGQYRWFEHRGVPIRDASGHIVRWYVLLTDIEDRTQALARLQQMQSDFAHMNRVSVMGELAASLSHEITQPITSARNNARAAQNFLQMQPPDLGEVREALACVVGDADRVGDIIDGIREQMKKAPPRKERFDLNAAINEVIVLARSVTDRNGVSVQTRLAEGLFPVDGDPVQLQQVLLNLVLNAAEAMSSVEEGARELMISTKQDQSGVVVAVRDSGPGIDPEHLEQVFDAFYTTKASGTGVGLSICRSIINAHGGKLWAEANKPRGALFQFTLPGTEAEFTYPL